MGERERGGGERGGRGGGMFGGDPTGGAPRTPPGLLSPGLRSPGGALGQEAGGAPPALAQDRLSGAMPKEEVGALRLRAR